MKTLFACDLDNTLLVPKRERQNGDICAEVLNGNEQSFLTPQTPELLNDIALREDLIFLPVTTRSKEQYERINLPVQPQYALICNGMSLLVNGELSAEWEQNFADIIKKNLPEAGRLLEKYKDVQGVTSMRIVDGKFLFAAFSDRDTAEAMFREFEKETELDIALSGRKIYWLPPGADKGTAVKRFAQKYGCRRIIAAGDSTIDLPMLDIADTALVPDAGLAEQCGCKDVRVCGNVRFSDFILSEAIL